MAEATRGLAYEEHQLEDHGRSEDWHGSDLRDVPVRVLGPCVGDERVGEEEGRRASTEAMVLSWFILLLLLLTPLLFQLLLIQLLLLLK